MTYEEEMNAFKKHLIAALPLMEAGDDIETLILSIRIEYADRKEELEADERDARDYEQMLADDLCALEQAQRVA